VQTERPTDERIPDPGSTYKMGFADRSSNGNWSGWSPKVSMTSFSASDTWATTSVTTWGPERPSLFARPTSTRATT